MSKRRNRNEDAIASLVVEGEPVGQPTTVQEWLGLQESRWTPRGDRQTIPPTRVRKLMLDPAVQVVRFYDGPHELELAEREPLWERMRPHLRGEVQDHTAFYLTEYKNDRRELLLIIRESC